MRACVSDRVADKVVGKIWIIGLTIEGELKDPGSGQVKLLPKRQDVRSYESQIFGDEREAAQFFLQRVEKARAGSLDPLP